jgi:hypothetical protein
MLESPGMSALGPMIEVVGWTGALLILGAYILLSTGHLDGRSRAYQWMNVVGAAAFVLNSGWNGALPSAVLNGVWIAIGLLTLWQIRDRTSSEDRDPTGRAVDDPPARDQK